MVIPHLLNLEDRPLDSLAIEEMRELVQKQQEELERQGLRRQLEENREKLKRHRVSPPMTGWRSSLTNIQEEGQGSSSRKRIKGEDDDVSILDRVADGVADTSNAILHRPIEEVDLTGD
jgi:hypothetical protein